MTSLKPNLISYSILIILRGKWVVNKNMLFFIKNMIEIQSLNTKFSFVSLILENNHNLNKANKCLFFLKQISQLKNGV